MFVLTIFSIRHVFKMYVLPVFSPKLFKCLVEKSQPDSAADFILEYNSFLSFSVGRDLANTLSSLYKRRIIILKNYCFGQKKLSVKKLPHTY